MSPATAPRPLRDLRLLVVGAPDHALRSTRATELADLVGDEDVVVVNDAATLPASIAARTAAGAEVELRFVARSAREGLGFTCALLGAGDHRTRTEDRAPPPPLAPGARLRAGPLDVRVASVSTLSPRLVEVEVTLAGREAAPAAALWAALYAAGRPVQYAYVPEPIALWDVQNAWASRPWAVEMPSAGRALDASALLALLRRGVTVARVTHAAGLSATGDPAIDRALPLPERYDVPEATVRAIADARARGGRVVAIGTSVVRALEGAARGGELRAGEGITDLRLGPGSPRVVVDAVLTGVHEADTTHFALLGAFASPELLASALALAERERFFGHEFGDACLVWGAPGSGPGDAVSTTAGGTPRHTSESAQI